MLLPFLIRRQSANKMLIDSKELLDEFIRPTLRKFSIDISGADYLLLGTAAQESHLQFYIHHKTANQNDFVNNYETYINQSYLKVA